jgi:hypothetical protein
VALAGVGILGVSIFAGPQRFESPRWVIAACGGAFVLLGGWTAAVYARGYDERRPEATLPSRRIQFAVLVPALLCLAAPFHWVAFGPGRRAFSMTVSIPFLAARGGSSAVLGRIAFGLVALLIDAMIVVSVVRLVRGERRK